MKEQFVLVDFENVQKLDLAKLAAKAEVKMFVGAQQSQLPIALDTASSDARPELPA